MFRRYDGGRTGVDYHGYVHLRVEEAIGVGAALMMVILADDGHPHGVGARRNLLRGRKFSGSLCFLFLDEANRLSHDNLGVIFTLRQTLDLQLLIAAPEVAHAEGNATYRLVRRTMHGV